MKWNIDNNGMMLGETRCIPVCANCGYYRIQRQTSQGLLYKLKYCPKCGHKIKWEGEPK